MCEPMRYKLRWCDSGGEEHQTGGEEHLGGVHIWPPQWSDVYVEISVFFSELSTHYQWSDEGITSAQTIPLIQS